MLCVVVTSRLQMDVGKHVREMLEGFGLKTVLLSEVKDVRDDEGIVVVPATGGTERIIANIIEKSDVPVMIWALPHHNSLASALEVYSLYRDRVRLHYSPITSLEGLERFVGMCRVLSGVKIGVVGGVSDWLLSVGDLPKFVEIVEIGFDELEGDIFEALRRVSKGLSAITVKCFDLIEHGITACLPLAMLDIPAGCEGDLNAVFTMLLIREIFGKPSWMANVCRLSPLVLAHCTVPLKMVEDYELTTHAESGKGVAVRGKLKRGTVTLAKYGKGRLLLMKGRVVGNLREKGLCRTQAVVECDEEFLVENIVGNHVVLAYGDLRKDLRDFCKLAGIKCVERR